MKRRLLAWLVVLCTLVCGCAAASDPTHDYILMLLENGEYDMAIHVIEGLKMYGGQRGKQPAGQGNPSNEIVYEVQPETNGTDWMYHIMLENRSEQVLMLQLMQIHDYSNGDPLGMYEFAGEDLERIGLGGFVLQPNEGRGWDDASPVDGILTQRDYVFVFHDQQGAETALVYSYRMENAVPAQQAEEHWSFPIFLQNEGGSAIWLKAMDITDFKDGEQGGTYIFTEGEGLADIGLEGLVLEPKQYISWYDGHPATDRFNAREYRFHFEDANGESITQTFRFDDLDKVNQPVDYSADGGKDLRTLRHEAAFETEVYPEVYWVPANTLGQSRYTNQDVWNMLTQSPESKREAVATLYEALQLYQVGRFTSSDDNVRMFENGIDWEHHKPGYHAVRTNTGCCATDSNWLHYLLDGDYDEVGFFATSQRNGSGHVYNYILQDGWYYFIDLTHYHADGVPMSAVEDAYLGSYYATDYILGNIHKTRSVSAYVDYVQQAFNDPPGLMFMYTADDVLAVDGPSVNGEVRIVYEKAEGVEINVVFDDPGDRLVYVQQESPRNQPDWDQLPSAEFGH